jgi:hypothetical protein
MSDLHVLVLVGCLECHGPTTVLAVGPREALELLFDQTMKEHGWTTEQKKPDWEEAWGPTVVRRSWQSDVALELHRISKERLTEIMLQSIYSKPKLMETWTWLFAETASAMARVPAGAIPNVDPTPPDKETDK